LIIPNCDRAVDRCQQEKRKTVNGEDIVWAFEALGFDQYSHLMKIYLQRYKDVMKMDKTGGPIGVYDHVGEAVYEMPPHDPAYHPANL